MITPHDLEAGMHAFADRMRLFGPRPVERVLIAEADIEDPDEFRAVGQTLQNWRAPEKNAPTKTAAYDVGLLDGFVLGVRAAREAAGREDSAR